MNIVGRACLNDGKVSTAAFQCTEMRLQHLAGMLASSNGCREIEWLVILEANKNDTIQGGRLCGHK
jgi:hypothetical protein